MRVDQRQVARNVRDVAQVLGQPICMRAASQARLTKPKTIRQRQSFVRIQRGGRLFKGRYICLAVATAMTAGVPQVGYTVSRRVGNAVVRNRVRRRLREIMRLGQATLCADRDYVLIAFTPAAGASYRELQREVSWLVKRAATRA